MTFFCPGNRNRGRSTGRLGGHGKTYTITENLGLYFLHQMKLYRATKPRRKWKQTLTKLVNLYVNH